MSGFILLVNEIVLVYALHMKCFRELKWLCINMLRQISTYQNDYMAAYS